MVYDYAFIFTSTEDDRYLVKGGIATYLGTLLPEASRQKPNALFIWITQSPDERTFTESEANTERHYLSRIHQGTYLAIEKFAHFIENEVEKKVTALLNENQKIKIFVESPDWEGLCADFFQRFDHPSVLKVTRCHGPMGNCFRDNHLKKNESNMAQHRREGKQARFSDLISCPSRFIFDRLESEVLEGEKSKVPHVIFGNSVETRLFKPKLATKEEALNLLEKNYGITIPIQAHTVFAVGSLEPRKGSLIIASALDSILNQDPSLHFCFIGLFQVADGNAIGSNSIKLSKATLLEKVAPQHHHRIHFSGVVAHHELPIIVHGADVHLVCYLADNFPGVLNEIALSELPLITAYEGGIPDMITLNGKVLATILDSGSEKNMIASLPERIRSYYEKPDLSKQLAAQLRDHILKRFSPDVIVSQYFNFYKTHLENKSKWNQ